MNFLRRPIIHQLINGNYYLRNICCSRPLVMNSQNISAFIGPFTISNALHINSIPNTAATISSIDQRQYSSTKSIWKYKLLKSLGLTDDSKGVVIARSRELYEVATRQINYLAFQKKFQSPDSFNTWFLITEIHIWMLTVRAMADPEHNQLIRNSIIEAMWEDVHYRAKKLSPTRQSLVRKQIEELSGQFQYTVLTYDEGLMTNDMRLASAIWERFFNREGDNFEAIEFLVKYVRMNIQMLDKMSREDLLKKRNIKWISIQACDKAI